MSLASAIAYIISLFLIVMGLGCGLAFLIDKTKGTELVAVSCTVVFLAAAWLVAWLGGV